MIRVQMTSSLKDRPPKIAGIITVRQFLFSLAAIAVAVPIFKIFRESDLSVRIILSFLFGGPLIFVGWMPQSEVSPARAVKHFAASLFRAKIRTHDGNNAFYRKKGNRRVKIKRYKSYKGYY